MSSPGGRVWKYGDDVNTDLLFPGKYTYTLRDPEEIAAHALEDLDPEFASGVRNGDVIVAGRNFGCGSSREQAATCLVYNGVGAVVAESFGRIFYRNAINNGLPVLVCPQGVDAIEAGQTIEIDLEASMIRCPAGELPLTPLALTLRAILASGGLIAHVQEKLAGAADGAPVKASP